MTTIGHNFVALIILPHRREAQIRFSAFWRVTHLILAGLGDDGSFCLGLLLFANLGKKFRIGPGGSPCPSVGDYLTECTACTNAKQKQEYCRNPTWDAPKVS